MPVFDVGSVLAPVKAVVYHWRQIEPYDFRKPVPRRILLAMIGVAVVSQDLHLIMFLGLSWHALLRPDEALSARVGDISDEGYPRVFSVRKPKMRQPARQHVLLYDESLIMILDGALHGRAKNEKLFEFDALVLAKRWARMLEVLQLTAPTGSLQARYTPGGLRAGGATAYYLATENILGLMWRGRWKCQRSLEHYLQLGVYTLNEATIPAGAAALVAKFGQIGTAFLQKMRNAARPPD